MTFLLSLYLALFSPPTSSEVDGFRATAHDYLTTETARHHLIVARAAGLVHRVRPELLLAIAYHESRYIVDTRTQEPGHRVSCGVMTPVPKARCTERDLTIFGGYDEGTAHLKVWLNYWKGQEVCALLSYAGGGALTRTCLSGTWTPPSACDISGELISASSVIRVALSGAAHRLEGY